MFYKVSLQLTDLLLLKTTEDFSNKRDHIRYAIETLIGELTKLIILSLFFILIKKGSSFAFAFISFSTIRLWSGGIHFKTYFGCLAGTLALYSAIIWLPVSLISVKLIVMAVAVIVSAIFVPLPDAKRPVTNKRKQLIAKLITIVTIAIWYYVVNRFMQSSLNLFLAVTLIFTLQLFIGGILHGKQKKYV
ncbi:MAG: accessory regulator [Clostridiales bacterium]|jgi:accessory gene regulator B|nr:accessory regulator [Clostridiales bacterium]